MGYFNPPLYKIGNKKCPHCGHNQGWLDRQRPWFREVSWKCSNCRSALKLDWRRHWAGVLISPLCLIAATLVINLAWSSAPEWWYILGSLVWGITWVIIPAVQLWWLESVKTQEESTVSLITSDKPSAFA